MTSLYLQKEKDIQLTLDGPTLAVQVQGAAKRLFPLQRLRRVFVHSSLDVSSRVLLACARAGVVICFTDARQNPLLWCIGQTSEDHHLTAVLRKFMARTDWENLLREWLERRQQKLLPALTQQLQPAQQTTDFRHIKRHITQRGIRYAGETQSLLSQQWVATETQGLLINLLAAQGVAETNSVFWSNQLATIICWQLEGARLHWLGRRFTRSRNSNQPLHPLTHEEFMGFFNKVREELQQAAERLLAEFALWLQQPLED